MTPPPRASKRAPEAKAAAPSVTSWRGRRFAIAIGLVVALAAIGSFVILKGDLLRPTAKEPAALLDPGWQFYAKPTSLEPPGTVFRIDAQRRRFIVDVLDVRPSVGGEVYGRTTQAIQTNAQSFSRLIDKPVDATVSQDGKRFETLEFEMIDVKREVTTDAMLEQILDAFRAKIEYRPDNRYFVIRETRLAKVLHYALSEQLVNRLGGTAALSTFVKTKAGLSYEMHDRYIISQELPEPMRIMFLAEEIVPASSSFAGAKPDFDTVPLKQPLIWE